MFACVWDRREFNDIHVMGCIKRGIFNYLEPEAIAFDTSLQEGFQEEITKNEYSICIANYQKTETAEGNKYKVSKYGIGRDECQDLVIATLQECWYVS